MASPANVAGATMVKQAEHLSVSQGTRHNLKWMLLEKSKLAPYAYCSVYKGEVGLCTQII
jgi:hypothetical protein